jgi:precorrin-6x reductase
MNVLKRYNEKRTFKVVTTNKSGEQIGETQEIPVGLSQGLFVITIDENKVTNKDAEDTIDRFTRALMNIKSDGIAAIAITSAYKIEYLRI